MSEAISTCDYCLAEVRPQNMRHHYRWHAESGNLNSGIFYRDRPLHNAMRQAQREITQAELDAKSKR